MSRTRPAVVLAACWAALIALPAYAGAQSSPPSAPAASPAYPLKASENNRYLVDRTNAPFLMIGDAPQMIFPKLSPAEARTFIENRRRYGVNALWINLLSNHDPDCKGEVTTVDGIAPFTAVGDLSTPNPAYFRRAEDVVGIAAVNRMVVLLDPIETGCWLTVLRANGAAKAFAYGEYLGARFAALPNIIWLHGNDFQSIYQADNELVQAVARGIRSKDSAHMQTVELLINPSLDDASWAPLIELDMAYTYYPAYAQVLAEYNRPGFKPIILLETSYEFENLPLTGGGTPQALRHQEYWAMLSGAAGLVYGSSYGWRLDPGWETKLDTPGIIQLSYLKDFFASRPWFELIPDQSHTVVTAGYQGFAGYVGDLTAWMAKTGGLMRTLLDRIRSDTQFGYAATNGYATTARTPDGSLVVAYLPSIRTVTVDMSKLASPTTARWYDPTNASYVEISASRLANSGSRQFAPPGKNHAGDEDWVLLLEATPAR